MTIPAGACPRDGKPLALARQLCPISPIYWRTNQVDPTADVRCRVIGRAENSEDGKW